MKLSKYHPELIPGEQNDIMKICENEQNPKILGNVNL